MKLRTNLAVQILGLIAQTLDAWGVVFPAKYKVPIAIGIAGVQAASGLVAHFSNPDGAPASEPYAPAVLPDQKP